MQNHRDVVVIGASAGGVEALTNFVSHLSPNLPASLFVVIHFPTFGVSVLPQILSRSGSLPALHPEDGELIQQGRIYIAPPDHHLLLRQGQIRLSRGPRENGHRPAIDATFRSAAQFYKNRVIGVLLSGTLDDGTIGLGRIKSMGGLAIVQDPEEALFDGMLRNAIENVPVDQVLRVAEIASWLNEVTYTPVQEVNIMPDDPEKDASIVRQDKALRERGEQTPGTPSPLTCPECGGVLWELHDHNLIQFRCHVGHVYSLDGMLSEQAEAIEKALWSAVRILEEKAALSRRMAKQAHDQKWTHSEARFRHQAEEAERNADIVRQLIFQPQQNFE